MPRMRPFSTHYRWRTCRVASRLNNSGSFVASKGQSMDFVKGNFVGGRCLKTARTRVWCASGGSEGASLLHLDPRRREKLLPCRVCLRAYGHTYCTMGRTDDEEKGVSNNVIVIAWTVALLSWILELATSTWSSGIYSKAGCGRRRLLSTLCCSYDSVSMRGFK
jgi:hypothetical protein